MKAYEELSGDTPVRRKVFDRYKLRAYRQARGVTQLQLALACNWSERSGPGRVRQLESGRYKHKLTRAMLEKLARALSRWGDRVRTKDLLTWSDQLDESREIYETLTLTRRRR